MQEAIKSVSLDSGPVKFHWRTKDITGKIYGRLTVIGWNDILNKNSRWRCRCDCGEECIVYGCHLNTGATQSCGCMALEETSARSKTHGMSGKNGHPLYRIWKAMIQRCYNKQTKNFHGYGGRGIAVCERWRHSFPNFLEDMGERPSQYHSIDRINNDLGYSPENCRWSTRIEQGNNKRNNAFLQYGAERKTLSQWSRELGLNYGTLCGRIERGWSAQKSLTTPARNLKRRLASNKN